MGKVIYKELYKRLKFDHADKWDMHKPESFQVKCLRFFRTLINKWITQSMPDLVSINK